MSKKLQNLQIAIREYNNAIRQLKTKTVVDDDVKLLVANCLRYKTSIGNNINSGFFNPIRQDYDAYTAEQRRPEGWRNQKKVIKVLAYANYFKETPFYYRFTSGKGWKQTPNSLAQVLEEVKTNMIIEVVDPQNNMRLTDLVPRVLDEANDAPDADTAITDTMVNEWFDALPYMNDWYFKSKFKVWRDTHSKRDIYIAIKIKNEREFVEDYEAYRNRYTGNRGVDDEDDDVIDTEDKARIWLSKLENQNYKKFYYTEVNPENDSSYSIKIMYEDLFVEKNQSMINRYQRFLDNLESANKKPALRGGGSGGGSGSGHSSEVNSGGSGGSGSGSGDGPNPNSKGDGASSSSSSSSSSSAGSGSGNGGLTNADKILIVRVENDLEGSNKDDDIKYVGEWMVEYRKVNGQDKSQLISKQLHAETDADILATYGKDFNYMNSILSESLFHRLQYQIYRQRIDKYDSTHKVKSEKPKTKEGLNLAGFPLLVDDDGDGEITEADFAKLYGVLNSSGKYIIDNKKYSKEFVQAQVNRANALNPYTRADPNSRIDPTTLSRDFEGDSKNYEEDYSGGSSRPIPVSNNPVNMDIVKPVTNPVVDKKAQILDIFESRSESQAVILEDKKRNNKNLSTLKEEIRCFHKIYNDLIPIFTSKEHKEKYDKAIKSDSVKLVKEHHIEMSDQIRKYFKTSELKLGVIMSAESVFGSGEIGHIPSMMGSQGQGVPVHRTGIGGGGSVAIPKGKDRYANARSGERNIIRGGVNSRKAIGKAIPKDIDSKLYVDQIPEPDFGIDDAFRPRTYIRRRVHRNPSVKIKSNTKT